VSRFPQLFSFLTGDPPERKTPPVGRRGSPTNGLNTAEDTHDMVVSVMTRRKDEPVGMHTIHEGRLVVTPAFAARVLAELNYAAQRPVAPLHVAFLADHMRRGAKGELSSPGKVYSEEASRALGVSRQSVDKHVWRGNKIAPDVLAEITGTDLDNGRVLDELATVPRDQQHARLSEIAARRSQVRLAPDPLNDPEAHEKQLGALMSAWNRAAGPVRQEFMLRIDTPVFDRGAA